MFLKILNMLFPCHDTSEYCDTGIVANPKLFHHTLCVKGPFQVISDVHAEDLDIFDTLHYRPFDVDGCVPVEAPQRRKIVKHLKKLSLLDKTILNIITSPNN
jgi:hypothetical protein